MTKVMSPRKHATPNTTKLSAALRFLAPCVVAAMMQAALVSAGSPQPLVELRVTAHTKAGNQLAVASTTPLRQGDALQLEITPRRAAHLYVIHVAPSGAATLLHTSVQAHARGEKLRLPTEGEAPYVLDGESGRELIAVLASEGPLEKVNTEYAAMVRSVQERRRLPQEMSLDPERLPPPTAASSRSTERVAGVHDLEGAMRGFDKSATTVLGFAAKGVAIAVLPVNHVR